jgi:hypothetical protein
MGRCNCRQRGDVVVARQAWRQVESEEAAALTVEVLARRELVRQLQKNEGALLTIFPGKKRLVRTFFRPTRKKKGGGDDGGEG